MSTPLQEHPQFTSFKHILNQLGGEYIQSTLKRSLFKMLTGLWRMMFRINHKTAMIKNEFEQGLDGFEYQTIITKTSFRPEFTASFILNDTDETDPIKKAAQLAHGAASFYYKLKHQGLEVETESGKSLDMQRYHYLFSRNRKPLLSGSDIITTTIDTPATHYVMVMVSGQFYQTNILNNDGTPLSYNEIYQQIYTIVHSANEHLGTLPLNPIGSLSTLSNKDSVIGLQAIEQANPVAVKLVDEALFILSLDLEQTPQNLDQLSRLVHVDNYYNRDYRSGMIIAVSGNARAGILVDPHTGIGGSISAYFGSQLIKHCSELSRSPTTEPKDVITVKPLIFTLPESINYTQLVTHIQKAIEPFLYDHKNQSVYKVSSIGNKFCKEHNISGDALFHMGLHLAFNRTFGKVPQVSNFISLRNVKHGDIWRYPCTTSELETFTNSPSYEHLMQAMAAHKNLIKRYKKADAPLYFLFLSIKRLSFEGKISKFSVASLSLLLNMFIPNFIKNIMTPDIWTSHIPGYKELAIAGRPGVKISFLRPNSFCGHYMVFKDHITVCFVHTTKQPNFYGREGEFANALEHAINEIKTMIEAHRQPLQKTTDQKESAKGKALA